MKKILFLIMMVFCLNDLQAQGIKFFEGDFKTVLQKAKAENKLVFIDCYTSWCVPCKKLAKTTFTEKAVGDYFNKNFINVKVDMQKGEGPALLNAYKVNAFPTFLFLNSKGELVLKDGGFKSAEEFLKVGSTALANKDKVQEDKNSQKVMSLLGVQLPEFTFIDVNDQPVKLSSLKGKYLFIDVWATWCRPCCGELPYLAELEKKFEGKNITFVSISVDQNMDKWKTMVKEENLGGVQLNINKDRSFMKFFGIRGIPHFILVDPEGKVLNPFMNRPSQEITSKILSELKGI